MKGTARFYFITNTLLLQKHKKTVYENHGMGSFIYFAGNLIINFRGKTMKFLNYENVNFSREILCHAIS